MRKNSSPLNLLRIGTVIAIALAIVSSIPSQCSAESQNWNRGPISLQNQYPLALLHYSFAPASPEIVDQHALQLDSSLAWSNTYDRERNGYVVDAETRVLNIAAAVSPAPQFQLRIEVPFVWRGGGILDEPIKDFHRTFGFPSGHRPKVADNQFEIAGHNDDGSLFGLDGTGLHPGNIALDVEREITVGTDSYPAWSVVGIVTLPTAAENYGGDAPDTGVGILGSKGWSPFWLYWGASDTLFGDRTAGTNLSFQTHRATGFVTGEYAICDELSLTLGVISSSALLNNVRKDPGHDLYLDVGLIYAVTSKNLLQLLLREDPPARGTADVTFLIGFRTLLQQ